jgi:LPS export ABC transporter permease LptG
MLAWYLSRRLGSLTLLVVVFFALIEIFTVWVQELSWGLWPAWRYALLQQPPQTLLLLPSALLLAGIWFFFGLLADGRWLLLQSMGWSSWNFYQRFWPWFLFLLVFLVFWTEWLIPQSAQAATLVKVQAESPTAVARIGENLWLKQGQQFIRIGALLPDGRLQEVKIYTLDAKQQALQELLTAELAWYLPRERVWQLQQVERRQYQAEVLTVETWQGYRWQSDFTPQFFQSLLQAPATHSVPTLLKIIDFMEKNGLSARAYHWALWQKIGLWLLPLFLFGALWAALWRLSSLSSNWLWLWAILAALAVYLALRLLANLAQAWLWPAALAGLLPSVLLALLWWRLGYRKT